MTAAVDVLSAAKIGKRKTPQLPLVVITWEDHTSRDGWQGSEDAKAGATPAIVTSVGWLHHETAKVYSLVSCASEDGDVSCQQTVLKVATVEVYHVPQPKKKRKKAPASTAPPLSSA